LCSRKRDQKDITGTCEGKARARAERQSGAQNAQVPLFVAFPFQ
jgi:hypothetical protein